MLTPLKEEIADVVIELTELTQYFDSVVYQGEEWDLSHLTPFTFKAKVPHEVTVLVIFSCHCFSHSFKRDGRSWDEIPEEEIYDDGRERRVLNPQRYQLSQHMLRSVVLSLDERRITLADDKRGNFVTFEVEGMDYPYGVFFEVERDHKRKNRLIFRIQSAYPLEKEITQRQRKSRKINFDVLLKAAFEGRKIRP